MSLPRNGPLAIVPNERPCLARAMEGRSRTESRVTMRSAPAKRGQISMAPHRPRLYLLTPPLGDTAGFASNLEAVLDAGDIAAVLLRLDDGDEHALIDRAKTIAAIVQRRDIALLLDGRPEIAVRAGADGAHLPAPRI